MKKQMLSLNITDPYAMLGIAVYLNHKGYEVPALYSFGELNIRGFLYICHLNQWIDITPDDKMVYIENGTTSPEERKSSNNKFYDIIFFDTPDDLFDYLNINETI